MFSIQLQALDQNETTNGRWVEAIELRGSTIINRDEAQDLFSSYLSRTLFEEDLVALRNRVTRIYIDKGYLSSGAVASPDSYSDGILFIDVIEGSLPETIITTSGKLSSNYLGSLVQSELSVPLNIRDLQSAIQLAEQDTRIDYIRAQLQPGDKPGTSRLNLSVTEKDPLQVALRVNNYRSPSVGEAQFQLGVRHQNLTGRGDDLSLFFDTTEGTNSGGMAYRYPFPSFRGAIETFYSLGDTIVVEEPFDQIDIESEIDTVGILFNRAFGDVSGSLALSAGIERKTSKTTLLGQRYDYSFGYSNGESEATVLAFSINYSKKSPRSALVVRGSYRQEIELFGLQSLPSPVNNFQIFIAQLQYATRFEWFGIDQVVWSTRANLQLTEDILPSFERIALGGHQSIRGYRENRLLKDNAFEISSELEIPLLRGSDSVFPALDIVLVPFLGFARGWQSEGFANIDRFDNLSSTGLGLKVTHSAGVRMQIFWAERFSNKDRLGSSLQDDGVQMELSYVF
jgi:hemolysin activation/secretion protein